MGIGSTLRTAALGCAVALLSTAGFAAVQVSLATSRTSGVAPLAVHFDASATTDAGANGFHTLRYEWSFGDSTAGSWGPSGKSRNADFGPIAAHVFEQAGSFTVSLRVTNSRGESATATRVITVSDPDSVFSGANTVCVSSSGSFAGCPSGAQQVTTQTFGAAIQQATSGRRVLLRRGDAFSAASTASVRDPGPGSIGVFGTGTARARVNSSHAGTVLGFSSSATDWRVADIAFFGPGVTSSNAIGGSVRRVLIQRVEITDFHVGILLPYGNAAQASNSIHSELFVVDSHLHHFVGGSGGNGMFVAATDSAFLGNVLEDSLGAEHVVRVTHAERMVIAHNRLKDAPAGRHLLKLHSVGENSAATSRRSHLLVISDNTFEGGSNGWDAGIGPQNDLEDERVYDVVVERNLFRAGTLGTVSLLVWAQDVTVRNNVFDLSKTGGGKGVVVTRRGIEPTPDGVEFYNNSCFTATGTITCATFGGSNHLSANNLIVGPAGSGIATTPLGGGNVTLSVAPWPSTSPTRIVDYKPDPTKSSALIDQGIPLAVATADPLGTLGVKDGDGDGVADWDVGAFEIAGGSGTVPPPTTPPPAPPPASAPAAPVLLP